MTFAIVAALARALPMLARMGGAAARAGAGGARAGGRVAAQRASKRAATQVKPGPTKTSFTPEFVKKVGSGTTQRGVTAGRGVLARAGKSSIVRKIVRFVPRGSQGGAFSGRVAGAAGRAGVEMAIAAPRREERVKPQSQPGFPAPLHGPDHSPEMSGPQNVKFGDKPPPGPVQNDDAGRVLPMLKKFSSALGPAAKMTGAASAALAAFAAATEKSTRLLAEQRRELAPYSGAIAGALARLDIGDIRRRRQTAQETSGSSRVLINSVNRMHDSMRELNEDFSTISNLFGAAMAKITDALGQLYVLTPLHHTVEAIEELMPGDPTGSDTPARQFFEGVAGEDFAAGHKEPHDLPPLE